MSDSNTSPSLTLWSVDASSETEDLSTEYDPPSSPRHTSNKSMDRLITFKRMSDSNTTPSFTLRKQLVDDSSDSSDEREDLSTEYDPPSSPRQISTKSISPPFLFKRPLHSKISPRSQRTVTNWSDFLVRTRSSSSYESGKSSSDSGAPSSISFKSDRSMDRLITFKCSDSGAPSSISFKSDRSMDRPITFKCNDSGAPSSISFKSDRSMDPHNAFKRELHNAPLIEECLKCSLCENVMKDPVFVPCGDTFCKTCIQKHLNEDCSCPNCCKRFERYPDLPLNKTLDRLLKQMDFSHALPAHSYAGPGDVACDICTGKKIRASKSCLTCDVSYCETHVRHHYTLEAFSHHVLVDATKDLKQNICQQDDGGLDELILPINKVTII